MLWLVPASSWFPVNPVQVCFNKADFFFRIYREWPIVVHPLVYCFFLLSLAVILGSVHAKMA